MDAKDGHPRKTSPLWRWTMLACGWMAVALGVTGIFLPVLPTVPFLLLALACFARSSERFYTWLREHSRFGPLVRPYLDGNGIPLAAKKKAIALIWLSIGFSVLVLVGNPWIRAALVLIALGVTLYLLRLPVAAQDAGDE